MFLFSVAVSPFLISLVSIIMIVGCRDFPLLESVEEVCGCVDIIYLIDVAVA